AQPRDCSLRRVEVQIGNRYPRDACVLGQRARRDATHRTAAAQQDKPHVTLPFALDARTAGTEAGATMTRIPPEDMAEAAWPPGPRPPLSPPVASELSARGR